MMDLDASDLCFGDRVFATVAELRFLDPKTGALLDSPGYA